MRFAVLALVGLAACSLTPSGSECTSSSQCGDDVCARTGECMPMSAVRAVTVKWTLNGAAADAMSCATHPDLYVQFDGVDYGDTLRFAPVPCREGQFFVDTLPKRYVQVEVGIDGGGTSDASAIDKATGMALIDLFQ